MTSLRSVAEDWDVVVIGAGLGGSVAAWRLAKAGVRVLLVERSTFPRNKVCGCCLGPMALDVLHSLRVLPNLKTLELSRMTIATPSATRSFRMGTTHAASREHMDEVLVQHAVAAGATFIDACRAKVSTTAPDAGQVVMLACGDDSAEVRTTAIIDAAGLASHRGATDGPSTPYVGLGAILEDGARLVGSADLRMAITPRGYLGAAPLSDGRATLAAAVKREAIQGNGERGRVLAELGNLMSLPSDVVDDARFHGVPPVRARQPAQSGAVFRVGDAARFVEPITGEGMGWALAAGDAVTPHILNFLSDPSTTPTWPHALTKLLRRSQRRCAIVAAIAHQPVVLGTLLRLFPSGTASGIASAASGRGARWGPA